MNVDGGMKKLWYNDKDEGNGDSDIVDLNVTVEMVCFTRNGGFRSSNMKCWLTPVQNDACLAWLGTLFSFVQKKYLTHYLIASENGEKYKQLKITKDYKFT